MNMVSAVKKDACHCGGVATRRGARPPDALWLGGAGLVSDLNFPFLNTFLLLFLFSFGNTILVEYVVQ
jgi:hypothetical protein